MLTGRRNGLARLRALSVFCCLTMPVGLMFCDFGEGEHVLSPIHRGITSWWRTFTALDVADVAKAQSVGEPIVVEAPRPLPKAPPPKFKEPGSIF